MNPEFYQVDFMVHSLILLMLTVFYGYFSLCMDGDPAECWGPLNDKQEEIIDAQLVKEMDSSETISDYENVGQQFRDCFDALFFASCGVLIA